MTISIPMVLFILAFGPLNWTFPWWLWTIAIVGKSLEALLKVIVKGRTK